MSGKRLGPSRRSRSGRRSVSEWLVADCSVSGATTQTSSLIVLASFSRVFRPGAWMPSSLVTSTRALRRLSGFLAIGADRPQPAEVGPPRLRHGDADVGLLVVLHDGHEDAADRHAELGPAAWREMGWP